MFTNYRSLRKIPDGDIDVFGKVFTLATLVWKHEVAYPKKKLLYRCHSVCAALSSLLPSLTVVHGHYLGAKHVMKNGRVDQLKFFYYPHSWLVAPGGTIIDPYSVGCIAHPILVMTRGRLSPFGNGLYIPNPDKIKKFTRPAILKEAK